MAFLKVDKKDTGTYLRIVQSFRGDDGHSHHRTLINLGKAEDYPPETLKKIGQTLYELGGGDAEDLKRKLLRETARYNYGFPMVVHRLLGLYSLSSLFDRISKEKNLGYSLTESLTLLISERLYDPVSKLSSYKNQCDYIGLEALELHQIYRTLDHLYENQERIKSFIYSMGRNLFNQKLDVVFYDVTTFYFESGNEDGFREKGFGKDGKIGSTIILFGLLIDKNKQPVGYEVYRGRKYEGHTFTDSIIRLKKTYQIDKIVCVADTGMMNEENLMEVESADYEYIVGERFKNIAVYKQNEILDLSKFKTLEIMDQNSEEKLVIQYYETHYKGKRLITTYSENRAKKDCAEREEKVKKAMDFLTSPSKLDKKAKQHYLKKVGDTAWELNEEKIRRDELFDGFLCIATNNENLSADRIIDAYKHLYKIEHAFRSFKSFLETRPMFHWTERRILGHLCLCYVTYALLNHLQLLLKKQGMPQSEGQIRKHLAYLEVSLVVQDGDEYILRSATNQGAKQIMKALSIKEMPDMFPKNKINEHIYKPLTDGKR